jgi:hypothetical protein
VGFVVDKVALGQVFSEYFGFPCQSSFHQILHHNHPGQATIGQSVAAVPCGPSWTTPPLSELKKKQKQKIRIKFSHLNSLLASAEIALKVPAGPNDRETFCRSLRREYMSQVLSCD